LQTFGHQSIDIPKKGENGYTRPKRNNKIMEQRIEDRRKPVNGMI
jgi:hypothetical protein